MNIHDYHTLRAGLQWNARPVGAQTLSAFERSLEESLAATGLFHSIEVGHTDDADRLLIAMVGFAPELDQSLLAQILGDLWVAEVGHGFWEAHSVLSTPGQLELQAASRESAQGEYVTVQLIAQAAAVPAQRPAPLHEHVRALPVVPAPRAEVLGWRRLAGPALAGA